MAAATTNFSEVKLSGNQGLIQGICDNYDTNITSQNDLKTTHSLATIINQPINNVFLDPKPAAPRLKKAELKNAKLSNTEMHRYKGEQKPLMLPNYYLINVLVLKALPSNFTLSNQGM